MILADKIIKLRKKNGWSQEELAEKMNVSRQAVSKWESAQSIPDLEKILQLGELFGVTTDYLLKDDIEDEEFTNDTPSSDVRRVSVEEANKYIELRKWESFRIAFATFLCILSPITLLLLGAASDNPAYGISETFAGAVGLAVLFAFVLIAVPIFIICGFKNAPYEFLDKNEPFELEYGVSGIIKEKQKAFRNTYVRGNIIATCICIFSPLPLIISAFAQKEMLHMIMLAVTIILAGIGVYIFIAVGVQNASMQKLLSEGEYTRARKKKNKITEAVESIYWAIVLAIYLGWSFLSGAWHITWVVWPIAAILSAIITTVCNLFFDKSDKNEE